MALGQRRDVARASDEFRSIIHPNGKLSGHVILKVRSLAARGLGDRFDIIRPSPTRVKNQATNLSAANSENLGFPVWEISNFFGTGERLVLSFLIEIVHRVLLACVSSIGPVTEVV